MTASTAPAPGWPPSFGAWPGADGTAFRLWSTAAARITLRIESSDDGSRELDVPAEGPGRFSVFVPGVGPGALYRYRMDEGPWLPDPASRFQPLGVHGPSQVVDPQAFAWTDVSWTGIDLADLVLYELHVGTFTPEGTFASAIDRLDALVDLGISAVELMPVADFPGRRNWGYDGAALFAPSRAYGTPDDLRRFVDEAHRRGVAVHLDVVYNHLGPDGAYLAAFSPAVFSPVHRNPWGAGINLDAEGSDEVRRFFIENALHWLHEYHLDGLRLDATHALVDDSPRQFLADLTDAVARHVTTRRVHVIAEDHRNLAAMVRPVQAGGWGLDAVWADDFHHQVRRHVAGDHEGYYRDFTGSTADLATTVSRGWFFTGQPSMHLEEPRGTDPAGLPPAAFVIAIQNHDQIGNRAFGERLHHQVDLATWRAASVLLLVAPETPLLFMGQEWAASSPFRFFTDHGPDLGRLVTEGRRHEFRHFAAFSSPDMRERIPDPQSEETFAASRLDWAERNREPHAGVVRLYRALLGLRRSHPGCRGPWRVDAHAQPPAPWRAIAVALDDGSVGVLRQGIDGTLLMALVRLSGAGRSDSAALVRAARDWFPAQAPAWSLALSTEDDAFCLDPTPPPLEAHLTGPVAHFRRPGAVILEADAPRSNS